MAQSSTTNREKHIERLFAAELQFRLASAVRIATTLNEQPLDLPVEWIHGRYRVKYREIALRQNQADYAALFLHRSATYLMAVAIKDAIPALISDPKNASDPVVMSAYQIARMIRNAFAHAPFDPVWSIDSDCHDRVFSVPRVITLDTHGLQGQRFDWKDYGGPLALFRLCRFVRIKILRDIPKRRRNVPPLKSEVHQIGNLIMKRVDRIPPSARAIKLKPLPDGRVPIPGAEGYFIRPAKNPRKHSQKGA
jgi:hypothetical protein